MGGVHRLNYGAELLHEEFQRAFVLLDILRNQEGNLRTKTTTTTTTAQL